ncbi:TfoX/Sxy family protein [Alloyangia pacifica]|uniref:TfoX N-terminal domain-containing protein n=1 Tax=Alloyangia pacifica TaxID=311180 RepID=A0A1I6P0Y5_9RHOB|nr:TfoX/Sxy family protein [Alloyangia pacifica]SDH54594.1 TfoX N-terminal domain-containing protein [Alloyangia pacifica]SFS33841.1 TfoX N-terminal domain-containing protein [Alloyangia pacifica]
MSYDEGLAEIVRDDLGPLPGLSEKRMFGALCFLLDGNMICGVRAEGGLYRVGKEAQDAAAALADVGPAIMGGRRMGGYVEASPEAMADDATRARLTALALSFVRSLPPK